jgi:hypothetical protein
MAYSHEESTVSHDRPPVAGHATPDYILDVIRDWHRQQCQFDGEVDPDAVLTFETTVAEWRWACDLLDWRRLGRALDAEWSLGRPDAAWRTVLKPAKQRTLRDVCEFIASGTVKPSIEPWRALGKSCFPAGAFLAIGSLLRQAGADVGRVLPSTPLDGYTRRHLRVFLGPISRLAPNALPAVRVSAPWHDLSATACALGLLLGLVAVVAGRFVSPELTAGGGIVVLISWVGGWLASWLLPPPSVKFGSLETFRDLARAVAEGAQRLQG